MDALIYGLVLLLWIVSVAAQKKKQPQMRHKKEPLSPSMQGTLFADPDPLTTEPQAERPLQDAAQPEGFMASTIDSDKRPSQAWEPPASLVADSEEQMHPSKMDEQALQDDLLRGIIMSEILTRHEPRRYVLKPTP